MRFVVLSFLALALGVAHADGGWPQDEFPQDGYQYDEYYPEDQYEQQDQGIVQQQGDVTINIQNNIYIDMNMFPNAPAILPVPAPAYAPASYCFVVGRPWGWTIYFHSGWNGYNYPLAHGRFPWQFNITRRQLYYEGRCPNP